ncbi:cytochrome P450 [Streptomyces sparsogenes]|uniref:Cytochrome P450 n=1 Tax=Streptomyces sparsogenes DSM 40356 TaxID=1331668 RepID=A0A1R1S5K5_9ACTN|nr:cytochrome P450 [Streptomyces sparsogenes]OMI33536.1 cytochrome P450 [Streptomyces sparsogenes DSM 40356]
MTQSYESVARPAAVPPPGCPAHAGGTTGAEPLYGPEFTRDPYAVYQRLRETHGPLAPVELDPGVTAVLCVGYETALEILRRPEMFSKDPRNWRAMNEGRVPEATHSAQLIKPRAQAGWVDGEAHQRLRGAIDDSMSRIDLGALRGYVERMADSLIDQFAAAGEADLIPEYCQLVTMLVVGELFGCPKDIADRLFGGMAQLLDGQDPMAAAQAVDATLRDLIELKRTEPGADVTSWLIAHPARLDTEELVEQLLLLMGMGSEPVSSLISNALRVLLTDERFAGDLAGGGMLVEDALDEVLWTEPPLANLAVHFPLRDVTLSGIRLRAGEPVVISFAGGNQDALHSSHHKQGNRAHLAFSAGQHTCSGRSQARLIAAAAIEKLLDRLPDIELAVAAEQLEWRPGLYQRGLSALPVRFASVGESSKAAEWAAGQEAPTAPASAAPAPAAPAVPASPEFPPAPPAPPGLPALPGAEGAAEAEPVGGVADAGKPKPSGVLGFLARWRRSRK